MANISMNFDKDLTSTRMEQGEAVTPVIITSLTVTSEPSEISDAITPFGTMATDLEFEVFCPNCGRVELASVRDIVKHRCNCGYGVSVEMLRTSPN